MAFPSARSTSKPSLSHPGNAAHVAPSGSPNHIPTKFALLIGCKYRGNGVYPELEQTHEDVHKMKGLLKGTACVITHVLFSQTSFLLIRCLIRGVWF